MKTMQVGDLKARFSRVIEEVKNGEEVIVSYGRDTTNVAVLVPYDSWVQTHRIQLGQLEGKAAAEFTSEYEMMEEELFGK